MDAVVRGTETVEIPRVLADRVRDDPIAVPPVPVDQLGRGGGGLGILVEDAEPPEQPRRVRRLGDGGADLGQLGSRLEDLRRHALLAQRESQGQSTDSATDDCHPKFIRRCGVENIDEPSGKWLRSGQGGASPQLQAVIRQLRSSPRLGLNLDRASAADRQQRSRRRRPPLGRRERDRGGGRPPRGADHRAVVAADDEIAFPVSGLGPVLGPERTLVDRQHRLGEAGPATVDPLLGPSMIRPVRNGERCSDGTAGGRTSTDPGW